MRGLSVRWTPAEGQGWHGGDFRIVKFRKPQLCSDRNYGVEGRSRLHTGFLQFGQIRPILKVEVTTLWKLEHLDAKDASAFESQDSRFCKLPSIGFFCRVGRP